MHSPRLNLFRLAGREAGVHERVPWNGDTDATLAAPSESLGLGLRSEDDCLRLWDPAPREYLLEDAEERAGRVAAEQWVREPQSNAADLKERLLEHRERASPRRSLQRSCLGIHEWPA